MSPLDWLLLALLGAALFLAVRSCVRRSRRGGCCGGCARCDGCGGNMTGIFRQRAKDTKGMQKFCQKE